MFITLIQGNTISEVDFTQLLAKNGKTLLYFYPKDNTSGCSLEARAFTLHQSAFLQAGIHIVGVSKDSPKSHCSFIDKQGLSIDLISDENLILHKQFDVRKEKKLYGKTYMGAERSTFLLDTQGNILKERRKVQANGHVEELMKELGMTTS